MYKAILAATQRSFTAMKRRLGSHSSTGEESLFQACAMSQVGRA